MDEMNDSVSSNPEQFLNDGERLFNGIAADSNENQGGHDPHPFWKFEAQEGTSTSMLDLDWCWPDEISRPGGHTNNHNSSDCWSAASEAHCLNNNFLPAAAAAAASDAVFPPLLNVVTDGAENADAAVMKRQLQNTEKPVNIKHIYIFCMWNS